MEQLEERWLLTAGAVPEPTDLAGIRMWNDVVPSQAVAGVAEASWSFAATPTYSTVVDNGPASNRVDMVFLGDGYTADLVNTTYVDHINTMLDYMFRSGQDPFPRYEHFFNVYRVNVISSQTGADVPPENIRRDTALDATYYFDGVTDRLLYVNDAKANAAVNAALAGTRIEPAMKFVTVNDARFGGGGGSYAVYAGANDSANDVALHESGHSFAHLADEYDYGGDSRYTGPEPTEPNVTLSPSGRKWAAWNGYVDAAHSEIGEVGAYEGAKYSARGIYRPTTTSKMRDLGQPFNAVSREAFIREIYEHVRPLDSWTDNAAILADPDAPITVHTVDSDVIQVEWSVDGRVVAGASGEWFVPSDHVSMPGIHTVTVRAFDSTDWVRLDRSGMEQSVTWRVQFGANHAPTLNNSRAASLASIIEDDRNSAGTLVQSILASVAPINMIADVDGDAEGIAVIRAATSRGRWEYSLDDGGTWASLDDAAPDRARLLPSDSAARIRFLPNAGFSGKVSGDLLFYAWDQTWGEAGGTADIAIRGGSSPFSAAAGTARVTVNLVNEAPTRTGGIVADLAVKQGSPIVSLGLGGVSYSPGQGPPEAAQRLTYRVTVVPPAGIGNVLLADGRTKVVAGRSYSLSALRGMKFRIASPTAGSEAAFAYSVRDTGGTANGGQDRLDESLTIRVTAGPLVAALVEPAPDSQVAVGLLNDRKYLDVRFDDATALSLKSVLDSQAEIILGGAAARSVRMIGTPEARGGGVFRYRFSGRFGVGQVTVRFLSGSVTDALGYRLLGSTASFTTQ